MKQWSKPIEYFYLLRVKPLKMSQFALFLSFLCKLVNCGMGKLFWHWSTLKQINDLCTQYVLELNELDDHLNMAIYDYKFCKCQCILKTLYLKTEAKLG